VSILPGEYEVLMQMNVIDREVFYYLAQRTDQSNALRGRKCKISRSGIALDLSEREYSGRRRPLWVISSDDVKHSIERLVKSGLLRRFGESGKGAVIILSRVFLQKYLIENKSVQKQVARRLPGRLPGFEENKINKNNGLEEISTEGCPLNNGKVARTIYTSISTIADKPFSMTLDWKRDVNDLRMILMRSGCSLEKINKDWITEFISYWWGRQERKLTKNQWTAKLASQLIGYLRNPELYDQLHGRRLNNEREQQYVERNSKELPKWAKPPRDDNALGEWMRINGYGDGPIGLVISQTRVWLRGEIDKRMAAQGLPKIVH